MNNVFVHYKGGHFPFDNQEEATAAAVRWIGVVHGTEHVNEHTVRVHGTNGVATIYAV